MERSELKFSGINRRVSDYSNSGACEELINLRPLESGLEVAKSKTALFSAGSYTNLFVHHTSFGDKYIGEIKTSSTTQYIGLRSDGTTSGTLTTASFTENTSIAFLGDMIVISDKEGAVTAVYLWNQSSGAYVAQQATVPDVSVKVSYITSSYPAVELDDFDELIDVSTDVTDFMTTDSSYSDEDVMKTRQTAMLEFVRGKHKDRCYGMAIVAFNFTLTTGEDFWTFQYVPIDPYADLVDHYRLDDSTYAFRSYPLVWKANNDRYYMCVPNAKVKVELKLTGSYNAATSLFKSVGVYSTIPFAPYTLTGEYAGFNATLAAVDVTQYPEYVANAMFYKQFSVDLSELSSTWLSKELEFGSSASIATRAVMKVDAGATQRFGEMLSYNNRLHYYDGLSRAMAYPAGFNPDPDGYQSSTTEYLSYKTSAGTAWASVTGDAPSSSVQYHIVCCPDARIDRIYVRSACYALTASNKYNFSFNASRNMSDIGMASPSASHGYVDVPEDRVVNVTNQMSPLEFPVENSYAIGGSIQSLVVNSDNLTESQTGQWPVYAYTDNGVYALEQGNGNVLYARVTPASMLVAESNTVSSPYGHFFLSGGHLYNLRGKHAVIVSDALESEPHKEIRVSAGYTAMYQGNLYNIVGLESSVDFRTFCKGATLTYDPFADEIIVSNATKTGGSYNYIYSYVLDLRRKQWHKIDSISAPSGNASSIAKMYTSSSLGSRAVGKISVKDSILFADLVYTAENHKLYYSADVTCPSATFGVGTTLSVKLNGTTYASWTATDTTPAKIALSHLFSIVLGVEGTTFDLEYLSSGYYRILIYALNPSFTPVPWSGNLKIYEGDNAIMTFTFDGSYLNGKFQNRTTGVEFIINVGFSSTSFIAGNIETSVFSDGAVLLADQIANAINDANFPATASRSGSDVILVAKQEGSQHNYSVSMTPLYTQNADSFANFTCTNMSGGASGGTSEYYVNLASETESAIRLIHLESRPVSFGFAYSHIQRAVLLAKAKLQPSSGSLSLSIFGSDDLFSWTCISTGQKKPTNELKINRIRNNRPAHSWRYYKLCIGGNVPTDADIASVILDWYAINRRIG